MIKYIPSYRIVKLVSESAADVQDVMGKIRRVNLSDVHLNISFTRQPNIWEGQEIHQSPRHNAYLGKQV